jgi:hypothetical protein
MGHLLLWSTDLRAWFDWKLYSLLVYMRSENVVVFT